MKKINIKAALVALLLLAGLTSSGQVAGRINGKLTAPDGKPVIFATVSLMSAKDTAVIKGTLSSDSGFYVFEHVAEGSYLIRASSVGYHTAISAAFSLNAETSGFTVPQLQLDETKQALNAVTITAAKPLVEHTGDKTIINVSGSILAAGNSAMDILARAPGVNVDKDDNISLRGKPGVTVMINDKLTYLSAAQLSMLLRSTDGSTIQSIELIPNPSAKYDAAGNSGIINIRLKKNNKAGTNGTLTLGTGYGKKGKDNESISLNHQHGKVNLFGSFSRNDDRHPYDLGLDRIVTGAHGSKTSINDQSNFDNSFHNNSYRAGLDYNTSTKNTLGFVFNGYDNSEIDRNKDVNYISFPPGLLNSFQRTQTALQATFKNIAFNLNDKLSLDTAGQELSFDLDYSRFTNNMFAQYDTYFYDAAGNTQMQPAFLRNETPSQIRIRSGKADYALPLSKTLKLETGSKFSDVKTDNALNAQLQSNGRYVNDPLLTNHFIYDEKISAGYINLSKNYGHLTVQAGLRGEYTQSTGTLISPDANAVKRHYFDLFPSLFIKREFGDKNELGFSFSRRIDRPGYDALNPFIFYLDQYAYLEGNPFLKPQYTNKLELNYSYNKTINISAGYSHTRDAMTELFLTKGDSSFDVRQNIKSLNSYTLTLNSSYNISKWWTGSLDVTGFYNRFHADSLLGGTLNSGKVAYAVKTTQQLDIAKGYKVELLDYYYSPFVWGIFNLHPRYGMDAGISHAFADNRAHIKFSVSDIFNTKRDDSNINYQTDYVSIHQKHETRIGRLTFTYNFGSSQLKVKQHRTGADDESKRVKGNN